MELLKAAQMNMQISLSQSTTNISLIKAWFPHQEYINIKILSTLIRRTKFYHKIFPMETRANYPTKTNSNFPLWKEIQRITLLTRLLKHHLMKTTLI